MTDARFDIWPVLEHYNWDLPAPRGTWQSIKCGAHDDHHASCRISHDAGWVKCLACDFHGDAINVVQHYEGCTYGEAVSICETITGASDSGIPGGRASRGGVSRQSRDNPSRRRYNAPRVRHAG